MTDFLEELIKGSRRTVDEGYYNLFGGDRSHTPLSLSKAILKSKGAAVIAEIKFYSPSQGILRNERQVEEIAQAMQRGGATGISIVTEPKHFNGSLDMIARARKCVGIPILMKDIVTSPIQIECAAALGADAVLLIKSIYNKSYTDFNLKMMISLIHDKGLEVLLETHTIQEYLEAVRSEADIIGINNRDLKTLKINTDITKTILAASRPSHKIVVSESGIVSPQTIVELNNSGVNAFLIGSSIMTSDDIEGAVREFVEAGS